MPRRKRKEAKLLHQKMIAFKKSPAGKALKKEVIDLKKAIKTHLKVTDKPKFMKKYKEDSSSSDEEEDEELVVAKKAKKKITKKKGKDSDSDSSDSDSGKSKSKSKSKCKSEKACKKKYP